MDRTDWKYDFSSLPYWGRHSDPFAYDEYMELPKIDALCGIYSIVEERMSWYWGKLAVLRDREAPRLVINGAERISFMPGCMASADETLIFLRAGVYDQKKNLLRCPLVILDLAKSRFSFLDTKTVNPGYTVAEIEPDVYVVEADAHQMRYDKRLRALNGRKLRMDKLAWYDLDRLECLPDLMGRKRFFF